MAEQMLRSCSHASPVRLPRAGSSRRAVCVRAARGVGGKRGGAQRSGAEGDRAEKKVAEPPSAPQLPPTRERGDRHVDEGPVEASSAPPSDAAPPRWAPRGAVIATALSSSLGMAIAAVGARNFAGTLTARGWTLPNLAAAMPLPGLTLDGSVLRLAVPEVSHLGWAVAVAAGVTAARAVLAAASPAFREASDAESEQELPALSVADVAFVSLFTGNSEELLFRCTLLPAVGADWRGVVFAAAAAGALHASSGRSTATVTWGAAAGVAYGFLGVALRDGSAPMAAHALATAAAALLWRANHRDVVQAGAAAAAAERTALQQEPGRAASSRAAADRPAWWSADSSLDA